MKNAKVLAKAAGIYTASAALIAGANAAQAVHTASTKGCGHLATTIGKLEKSHDLIAHLPTK